MKSLSLVVSAIALVSTTPALAQAGFTSNPAARVYEPPHQAVPSQICPRRTTSTRNYAISQECAGDVGQRFNVGQLIPAGAGQPIGFAQLVPELRSAYHVNPDLDYVLVDNFLYELDHGTSKVRRAIPVVMAR